MEGSAIDVNDIIGVGTMAHGQLLRGDDQGDVEEIDLTSNTMLFGGASDQALVCSFGSSDAGDGGIGVTLSGEAADLTGTVTFQVQNDAIGNAKIQDNAVTLAKLAHNGTDLGIFTTADTTGAPTFLTPTADDHGKNLQVNSDGTAFVFADAQSATTVTVGAPDAVRRRVLIAGTQTDDQEDAQNVLGHQGFTYDADQSLNTAGFQNFLGAYTVDNIRSTTASGTTAALDLSGNSTAIDETASIRGTLVGTARASMNLLTTVVPADDVSYDSFYGIPFMKGNVGNFSLAGRQIGLSYNPYERVLKVPNLQVDGDITTINTQNLTVEDKTIRLGIGSSSTDNVTFVEANGTGLIVNIGKAGTTVADPDTFVQDNVEGTLPRMVWNYDAVVSNTKSVLGWKAAKQGTGSSTSLAASTAYGVGITHVTDETASTAGISNNTLDIGVGALALVDYDGTPELYIQVSV